MAEDAVGLILHLARRDHVRRSCGGGGFGLRLGGQDRLWQFSLAADLIDQDATVFRHAQMVDGEAANDIEERAKARSHGHILLPVDLIGHRASKRRCVDVCAPQKTSLRRIIGIETPIDGALEDKPAAGGQNPTIPRPRMVGVPRLLARHRVPSDQLAPERVLHRRPRLGIIGKRVKGRILGDVPLAIFVDIVGVRPIDARHFLGGDIGKPSLGAERHGVPVVAAKAGRHDERHGLGLVAGIADFDRPPGL